jgi:hypothetical protein
MTSAREMLEASPVPTELGLGKVAETIEACSVCAQACTSCANSGLAEAEVAALRTCVALCLNCADLCTTTERVLSRPFGSDRLLTHRLLEACIRACSSCAEECERHAAHHRHCALCVKACRACAQACTSLLDAEAFEELKKLAGA